ncbi:MAG: SH3 domain-containing protein [Acidobacteriota bacterium]|nr:SH3 domain-containing protein [Acidobacteriota bacterium]
MFKTLIFALLIFLAFAPQVAGQEKYVRFVDEAAKDKSFSDFRQKLLDAVKMRDAKFVLSILDPKIQNNFGGGAGIADFKKTWKINNRNSPFWDEMLTVLSNGGKFMDKERQTFGAPYLYAQPLPDNLDVFEYAAIFGENVNLRQQPNANSPIIATLSYNVVVPDFDRSIQDKSKVNEYHWVWVETLGGKKGYVAGQFVRSPIDYRAVFEKKNGKWKMTAFIAGD